MIARYSAPARVNLIGEHTDYTGGLVLPMAIPFQTTAAIEGRSDGMYSFTSDGFPKARTMTPEDRSGPEGTTKGEVWSDYPVGVLRELQALGIEPPPFALHFTTDVPLGAGLSSSASVEVATAVALLAHARRTLPAPEIALLCRRAENDFVGSPCGIMDQFVVTAAVRGHALLLNTRDLTYELLPMNHGELADCCIVIVNSGVRHSVASGEYGVRRTELELGQAILRDRYPELRDLGDANLDQLAACERAMAGRSYARCRHVVSENARVREARAAMLAGDPHALGDAMTRSHASMRDDFELSVPEIDFLVDTALTLPGCYGARLTGGGFGGCTVNLVRVADAAAFRSELMAAYRAKFAGSRFLANAVDYQCEAVDGALARLNSQ